MKRNIGLIGFIMIIGMLVVIGCHKDKVTDPAPDPEPIVTTAATPTVAIIADLTKSDTANNVYNKNTSCMVSIVYLGSGTFKDVTIKINGTTIPYNANYGSYVLYWDSSIATGSTVKLDVTSSQGDYSASGALPEVGVQAQVSIPGCTPGSRISINHIQ